MKNTTLLTYLLLTQVLCSFMGCADNSAAEPAPSNTPDGTNTNTPPGTVKACENAAIIKTEDHACFHAEDGPFVDATTGSDISRKHTAYRYSKNTQATFTYQSKYENGTHIFFFSTPVTAVVTTSDNSTPLPWECFGASTGECPSFQSAGIMTLENGKPYQLSFTGAQSDVLLVIEGP